MISPGSSPASEVGVPELKAKVALRVFVIEAIEGLKPKDQPNDRQRPRSPGLNEAYDEHFIRASSFTEARLAVGSILEVASRYGDDATKNLVLEFLYGYLDEMAGITFDERCFDLIWSRFRSEISSDHWCHVGYTILQNFGSPVHRIELADGIAVCLRTVEHTRGSINSDDLEQLKADWMQGARGSHALLVEHRVLKSPDNVRLTDVFNPVLLLDRALLALRLYREGDVRAGRYFFVRPALLSTRMPGGISGSASWKPGEEYRAEKGDLTGLREYYALLVKFESFHASGWKNISVALRRFTAVYDDDWKRHEDQVIDAMIAIEALLGAGQEITYRLSSRVASLLARSDDERLELYDMVKRYYDLRSTIVHGGELKEKHLKLLQDTSPIRDIVRRLLLAFLRLATGTSRFNKRGFDAELDRLLLHSGDRKELQQAMGLAAGG